MYKILLKTLQFIILYIVVHKNVQFYFYGNFGQFGPILIILSLLHSQISCRRSENYLASNLLSHLGTKFECSAVQLFIRVSQNTQRRTLTSL